MYLTYNEIKKVHIVPGDNISPGDPIVTFSVKELTENPSDSKIDSKINKNT